MEKCFEDARQDEKHVPDLLEAIMRRFSMQTAGLWCSQPVGEAAPAPDLVMASKSFQGGCDST